MDTGGTEVSLAICSVVDEVVHHEPFHDASFDLELFPSRCRIAHHEAKQVRKTPICLKFEV